MKIKQILKIVTIFTGLFHQIYSFGPLVDLPSNNSCNVAHLSHYYAKMNGDLKDSQECIKRSDNVSLNDAKSSFDMNNFTKESTKKLHIGTTNFKKTVSNPSKTNKYISGFAVLPCIAVGVYEYMNSDDVKNDSKEVVKDNTALTKESFNEKKLANQSLVRRIVDNKYSPYVGVGLSAALLYGAYLYYASNEIQTN